MKRVNIHCPYCGSLAVRRPASNIYGDRTRNPHSYLYVCRRWPACDSYVLAHDHNHLPMGTLADKTLRQKRIKAHHALQTLARHWRRNTAFMYRWLQFTLGLDTDQTHIAMFGEYRCDQIIQLCQRSMKSAHAPPILWEGGAPCKANRN